MVSHFVRFRNTNFEFFLFKATVIVVFKCPSNSNSQRYPLNLYLIKNSVFLAWKVENSDHFLFFCSINLPASFVQKMRMEGRLELHLQFFYPNISCIFFHCNLEFFSGLPKVLPPLLSLFTPAISKY